MEFRPITKVDFHYSEPMEEIGVEVSVKLKRELTSDENYELTQMCSKVAQLIRRNSCLADENLAFDRQLEKEHIIKCFPEPIYVREIPNEYYSESLNPWFLVTTTKGVIKIGWRKRVINIDWSESDIKINGENIFGGEDTTVGPRYVHAWNYTKAKEYLTKILNTDK